MLLMCIAFTLVVMIVSPHVIVLYNNITGMLSTQYGLLYSIIADLTYLFVYIKADHVL